jgi:hypothetical protein
MKQKWLCHRKNMQPVQHAKNRVAYLLTFLPALPSGFK